MKKIISTAQYNTYYFELTTFLTERVDALSPAEFRLFLQSASAVELFHPLKIDSDLTALKAVVLDLIRRPELWQPSDSAPVVCDNFRLPTRDRVLDKRGLHRFVKPTTRFDILDNTTCHILSDFKESLSDYFYSQQFSRPCLDDLHIKHLLKGAGFGFDSACSLYRDYGTNQDQLRSAFMMLVSLDPDHRPFYVEAPLPRLRLESILPAVRQHHREIFDQYKKTLIFRSSLIFYALLPLIHQWVGGQLSNLPIQRMELNTLYRLGTVWHATQIPDNSQNSALLFTTALAPQSSRPPIER